MELQFIIIVLLVSFGSSFTLFPHCKALLFYLNTSPVPTCLVHNCETSRRLAISICYHPCLEIKFPLIPINVTGVLGSSAVLTASQTTRLGKGSSVTMQDERAS